MSAEIKAWLHLVVLVEAGHGAGVAVCEGNAVGEVLLRLVGRMWRHALLHALVHLLLVNLRPDCVDVRL